MASRSSNSSVSSSLVRDESAGWQRPRPSHVVLGHRAVLAGGQEIEIDGGGALDAVLAADEADGVEAVLLIEADLHFGKALHLRQPVGDAADLVLSARSSRPRTSCLERDLQALRAESRDPPGGPESARKRSTRSRKRPSLSPWNVSHARSSPSPHVPPAHRPGVADAVDQVLAVLAIVLQVGRLATLRRLVERRLGDVEMAALDDLRASGGRRTSGSACGCGSRRRRRRT